MGETPNFISPKSLIELSSMATKPCLIDVRKPPAFEQSGEMISQAVWRDHERVASWGPALALEESVIVYCVHGHEVSQNTVASLLAIGVKARYLQGGFEGWLGAGGQAITSSMEAGFKGNDDHDSE